MSNKTPPAFISGLWGSFRATNLWHNINKSGISYYIQTMTIQKLIAIIAPSFILLGAMLAPAEATTLKPIGTYSTGLFEQGGAEIPAYDPVSQRLFVVNGGTSSIDVISISDPTKPSFLFNIGIQDYGRGVNSVAFKNGLLAAAIEDFTPQNPGKAVFFDVNGNLINSVNVGALPDMLTFTPDGKRVLVANEGEPNTNYTVDPEGSVSIINIADFSVIHAGFSQFNSQIDQLRAGGVRIFGPNATVAQDLEPEYITVSPDSTKAWISLQENNAIATLDLITNEITNINPLGFKDHSLPGNGFDASDRDNAINISNWPVLGMYQPDGIASYTVNGKTYIVTANEGDARDYAGFSEVVRLGSNQYLLDPTVFPNASVLKNTANLGRLNVTRTLGDENKNGSFEKIYSYGARSFSIWESDQTTGKLKLVFDSGDQFEQIIAQRLPAFFNSNNTENSFDTRSDDKGPEPEDVKIAKINGRFYAFVGLERVGGVMVYDITNPAKPVFVDYANNRDFTVPLQNPGGKTNPLAGDLGPEGLLFISAADSPNQKPLLITANEISGTTTIYSLDIETVPEPGTMLALGAVVSTTILRVKRKR
ncbi:alkaline phosphatase-like protein [Trichormus variabilis ATCC 29413]|uniref:Alkaline phosphatase-like protein n=2 Tax=Anabaena variabilis TaxID=264691 RepID=Q3MA30_TRIV2|nr:MULTISPECIES: choice-of-anchor I family protein [Nostocaceae]ABA22156.1 alkaline phosphatase-like protein [Trichormus variabilis ATCC 29413]